MHVSERGRLRVLREGRRNVHAWVRGTLSAVPRDPGGELLRYDPFTTETFVLRASGAAVRRAARATFHHDRTVRVYLFA